MITLAVGQMEIRMDARRKEALLLMASVMAVEMKQNGWREIHFKKELVGLGSELDI